MKRREITRIFYQTVIYLLIYLSLNKEQTRKSYWLNKNVKVRSY